jgi:1,4-alpha-glucan branching enzyme
MIPDVVAVTFHFPGARVPTAKRVSVIGSFNAWDPQVHRLRKSPEGDWRITIHLSPSRVVYCFDVDGIAWLDSADDGRVPNGWGSEYSVRYVNESETLDEIGQPSKVTKEGRGIPRMVHVR